MSVWCTSPFSEVLCPNWAYKMRICKGIQHMANTRRTTSTIFTTCVDFNERNITLEWMRVTDESNQTPLTFLVTLAWLLSAAPNFSPGGLEPQRRPMISAYAIVMIIIGRKNNTDETFNINRQWWASAVSPNIVLIINLTGHATILLFEGRLMFVMIRALLGYQYNINPCNTWIAFKWKLISWFCIMIR